MSTKKQINLKFPIRPKPKQSVRVGKSKGGKKTFYKDSKVVKFEQEIRMLFLAQILHVKKFEGAVGLDVTYTFKHPKNWSKAMVAKLSEGKTYRPLRPDLTDNINKGWVDVVAPYLMNEDSQISKFSAEKIYGLEDCINATFYEL